MAARSRKVRRSRESPKEDGAGERQATAGQLHGAAEGQASPLLLPFRGVRVQISSRRSTIVISESLGLCTLSIVRNSEY
jgi:hypothetical protein